jgi:hypothetical protein
MPAAVAKIITIISLRDLGQLPPHTGHKNGAIKGLQPDLQAHGIKWKLDVHDSDTGRVIKPRLYMSACVR